MSFETDLFAKHNINVISAIQVRVPVEVYFCLNLSFAALKRNQRLRCTPYKITKASNLLLTHFQVADTLLFRAPLPQRFPNATLEPRSFDIHFGVHFSLSNVRNSQSHWIELRQVSAVR
jgi:hypothetical protein